jgi:hypothetical protein
MSEHRVCVRRVGELAVEAGRLRRVLAERYASGRAASGMNVRSGSKGLSYVRVRIRSACSTGFYAGRERW